MFGKASKGLGCGSGLLVHIGYMVLIWPGNGSLFAGMCIVRPNPPPLSVRSPSSGFGLTFFRGIGLGLGLG
jgi:hypothetical protein